MAKIYERTVVPANPGWRVMYIWPEEEGTGENSHYAYEDIIAWEIERQAGPIGREGDASYYVTPILCSGQPSEGNTWCIAMPNGKYDFPYDRIVDNLELALQHAGEKYDKEQEINRLLT